VGGLTTPLFLFVFICSYSSTEFPFFLYRKPRDGIPHTTYDIKLVLLKLSTGKPHPAAKESTILVLNSRWDRPGISVEIVGDRLVLILSYHDNPWMPHDRVYIYDWRNAVLKMVRFIHRFHNLDSDSPPLSPL